MPAGKVQGEPDTSQKNEHSFNPVSSASYLSKEVNQQGWTSIVSQYNTVQYCTIQCCNIITERIKLSKFNKNY